MPKTKAAKSNAGEVILHSVEFSACPPGPNAKWTELPTDYACLGYGPNYEHPAKAQRLDGHSCCFLTGKDAADRMRFAKQAYAAHNGPDRPFRCRIVRHVASAETKRMLEALATWKEREAKRFDDGTYVQLPWAEEPWFKERHSELHHFAHVGLKSRTSIAYTASNEHGALDRQTSTKPGRYLEQFFREALNRHYSYDNIECGKDVRGRTIYKTPTQFWADKYIEQYGEGVELRFADTQEAMQHVYENGPESCMSGEAEHYKGGFHPVRVYAAGDLAVAYLVETTEDGEENIISRTLAWPEKKIYGRVYGDGRMLTRELDKLGYAYREDWILEGARLLKIPYNGHRTLFHMPYIDGCQAITDDGKFFRIAASGEYKAESQGGVIELRELESCSHCGDYVDEGSTYIVEPDQETYCSDCFGRLHGYIDSNTGEAWLPASDDPEDQPIIDYRHNYHHPRNRDNYFQCAASGSWYPRSRIGITLADGRYVSQMNASYAMPCAATGEYHLIREMIAFQNNWYSREAYQSTVRQSFADQVELNVA